MEESDELRGVEVIRWRYGMRCILLCELLKEDDYATGPSEEG